jgi:putative thioredoxin
VEDTCLEILEEDPDNPPAKLLLAKSLIWQGEYLEAMTVLTHFPASREFRGAERLKPLAEALLTGGERTKTPQGLEAVYYRAIWLINDNKLEAGLDGLVEIVRADKKNLGSSAREVILGVLELLGERHPLTVEYRQLLASALF